MLYECIKVIKVYKDVYKYIQGYTSVTLEVYKG